MSLNAKVEILRRAELFRGLDDQILELLAARSVEKQLARDEVLFLAGDPASGLYVIAEGSLRAVRTGIDGREQVIHIEHAVTTIAEVPVFDDGNYPSTVAAQEASRVYFIRKEDVRSVCNTHPELALAATRLLARRLRKCAELVETLSLREVAQRVAEVLLSEALATGVQSEHSAVFRLTMTHNQLAARVGTVREVVTRALHKLQTQGLITIKGKQITVPDMAAFISYSRPG
jgi:CRP-like cAMP-binding protein